MIPSLVRRQDFYTRPTPLGWCVMRGFQPLFGPDSEAACRDYIDERCAAAEYDAAIASVTGDMLGEG